jgi:hypothetical protein
VESPRLLGDIGVHELHELCELAGAGRRQEKMSMGRDEHEGMDGHAVEALGFADDAKNDLGQLGRGFEEQPALDSAGGDLDERTGGDEAERSGHE